MGLLSASNFLSLKGGNGYSLRVFVSSLYFVFCCLLQDTLGLLPLKLTIGIFSLFLYCNLILVLLISVLFYQNFIYFLVLQFCSSSVSFCGPRSEEPFYFLSTTVIFLSRMVIGRSVTVSLLGIFISNLKFILYVLQILLISSGSDEVNPGPNENIKNTLSFAMWNLDSRPVMESLQTVHNFDLLAICESSLSTQIPNDKIFIHGFSPDPFMADKPLHAHNGGVCLYYKDHISLKRRTDLERLEETIIVEISQKNNKKLLFIVSYRHPNQSLDQTESYFSSLNDIIENIDKEKPKAIVLTEDFNVRSSLFWVNDADTTEGRILGEVFISNNLEQLVNEPAHIHDDGTTTCIDLIFANQKYAFTNVEVLPHRVSQSKHLIIHGEVNFSLPSPPPYKRKIWDYNRANYLKISEDLGKIDWENLFRNA